LPALHSTIKLTALTLGLLTPPVMITTLVILAVLLIRLRPRRHIGLYQ
jgi:hypothetical protein